MNRETVPVIDSSFSKKKTLILLFLLFMVWIIIIKKKWELNSLWAVLHGYNTLTGAYYSQDCIKMSCRKLSCILFLHNIANKLRINQHCSRHALLATVHESFPFNNACYICVDLHIVAYYWIKRAGLYHLVSATKCTLSLVIKYSNKAVIANFGNCHSFWITTLHDILSFFHCDACDHVYLINP